MRRIELCVDVNDASLVLPWWRTALDWDEDGDELVSPDGTKVWFQTVPERKAVKNRLHLDVYLPEDEVPALQSRLVDELGGSVVRTTESTYVVLADPEGNELCLCWD